MSAFPNRSRVRRSVAIAASSALLVAAVASSPAAAARPTITHEINTHFHNEYYIEGGGPECPYPGVTAVSDGNEHFIVVDDGVSLKVKYGETFWYTETPDDPAYEPVTHQGTDALVFILERVGDELFHESFHDFGPTMWDAESQIRFAVTFKTVDGELLVEHEVVNDMPPGGC